MLKDSLELVDQYKDTPGVLMFAFGNESNYGLSWSSFEIENLPEGEQNTAKARFLYSLFNEVIKGGKAIAPNHPFSIVNGDIQYIDLIKELVPDLDILGSNVYRGKTFTSLWRDVEQKLDLPVLFFEFGSDAYNARELREDQLAQAEILKSQWREMYNKAYGNGEEGNAIGGFVFEWRDEWWKYLQEENLDTQDNNASWSNQAYLFDWAPGKNNMNEEWFGITALGPANSDGVYVARPRTAYDTLSAIWAMDPYTYKKSAINQEIDNINMEYLGLKGEVRLLQSENAEDKKKLSLTGGELRLEFALKGTEQDIRIDGENGVEFEDGQMVFLDFGFNPMDNLEGQFSVNLLGGVADLEPLEIRYGRRGLPVTVQTEDPNDPTIRGTDTFADRERIEIYDFDATLELEHFDLNAFYHTPRYHKKYEGDFYGLIREATDIDGIDIWNGKAPEGVEITGKGKFDGLTLLAGPEVYWGANPKVIIKYDFAAAGINWTFMHSEDVARLGQATGAAGATLRQSRTTTLYAEKDLMEDVTLEVGGIISAPERIDEIYDRFDDGNVFIDQIDFEDTLGFKAKLTFPFLGTLSYVAGEYAGLTAIGGDQLREFGTRLPYSGNGNKQEYEAGMMINRGNWMFFPRVLYRDNLVHANPFVPPSIEPGGVLRPGILPRDTDADPFAVLGNREARSAELFVTYDPTGATPFYQWDNDYREDAGFAFNVGANYTSYPTPTDANLFFFDEGGINASFGQGLPSEDVWTVSSRMVFNRPNARYITTIIRGFDQSTGDPNGGTRDFYELHGKAVWNRKHVLSGYFKKDAWGPYDFQRQFNVTFPEQYKLDYSLLLDQRMDDRYSTKIGVRALFRTNDENSPDDEFLDGNNDYIFQAVAYFTLHF